MVMLGGSADTASHALLYNLTSGQSSRLKLIYLPTVSGNLTCYQAGRHAGPKTWPAWLQPLEERDLVWGACGWWGQL